MDKDLENLWLYQNKLKLNEKRVMSGRQLYMGGIKLVVISGIINSDIVKHG